MTQMCRHSDTQQRGSDRSSADDNPSANQPQCLLCAAASLLLPSPSTASVRFLHGNIVCYEQGNSNFIVHDGIPVALITFLMKL